MWRAARVVAVVPRATRLGPPVGFETRIVLAHTELYVATRTHRDEIVAADAWSLPSQAPAAPFESVPVGGAAAPSWYPPTAAAPASSYSPAGQDVAPGYAPQSISEAYGIQAYAGFGVRFFANLIDGLIMIPLCVTVIGAVLYFPLMWWKKGATVGQKALGLKVVRAADGGPIEGKQALARFVVFLLEFVGLLILVGGLGFLWAAFDERKQTWHDKAAGTVVVYSS